PNQGAAWHDNGSGMGQTTLTPISLVGGKKYFIRMIYKEGGGGDYGQVAWRKEGDTTAASRLKPIPSEFLSAAVDLPGPPPQAPAGESKFTNISKAAGKVVIEWTGSGTLQKAALVNGPY